MATKQFFPCGSWSSPIRAELVARSSHELSQLHVDHGHVYWIEQFPEQKGRRAIMCYDRSGNIGELTDRNFNVRSRVHEYGGGDYCVQQGNLYFSNDRDQQLYRKDSAHLPVPLTPKPSQPMAWRYADGGVTPDGKYVICVRETHSAGHDVKNDLVSIATDGSQRIEVLTSGADFYASPRVSPDGTRILFLSWDHPQMPWEGTELHVLEFKNEKAVTKPHYVCGSNDESIGQPQFSSKGDIYFVSDRRNWWNLYCYSHDEIKPVVTMAAEIGYPAWIFATKVYDIVDEHRVVCIINENGRHWLAIVEHGKITKIPTDYDCFSPTLAVEGDFIYCIAAHGAAAFALLRIHLKTHQVEVLHSSSSLLVDAAYLSLPEHIEFPTEQQRTAHAYYYPPQNSHYEPEKNELPPLMVLSHGGPTGAATTALNLKIQYWTSRGFAVVDVNYGGSVGYGRDYSERLLGRWGVVDVADCVNAARYLVQRGKADANRLIIKGSSAGGFTTLCALIFYDVFAAGASYYGVADLEGLMADTHKFEAHYLDQLIGPYPQAKEIYQAHSPLYHAEKLRCPVIFFQGLEDKVVPPSQAEAMMRTLDEKQLPYAYVVFPHEQHGFRDSQSIVAALEAEYSFYSQIFNFIPADPIAVVEVKNKVGG